MTFKPHSLLANPALARDRAKDMNVFHKRFCIATGVLLALYSGVLLSEGLDPATLLRPADSWPTYHGDYSGQRHSRLTQITPQNVQSLALAWAFQTSQLFPIKSSPLLVNGVLYFTVPDNVWAVDARSGHQIWHYTYPRTRASAWAIGVSRCSRNGCISLRRTLTWFL